MRVASRLSAPPVLHSAHVPIMPEPRLSSGVDGQSGPAKRSSVDRPLIGKLVGVNAHERAERMVFVTTSRFTSGARTRANEFGVELVDGKMLASLIDEYVSCDRSDTDFADVTWHQLAACYPPDVEPPSRVYF